MIGYLPIVLPLMIWILTGFFRDFPDDLVDAARIDGLGTIGTLVRIVLPLSLPGLGVAVLFGFLVAWNEFVIALTITRTPASQTMPVGISTLITQFQTLWGEMMAVAAIYLLPVLAVTLLTQRGIVRGLMSGATKVTPARDITPDPLRRPIMARYTEKSFSQADLPAEGSG